MRPQEFAVWMKYGRKDPALSTVPLETFPSRFREWWRSLQPSERGKAGDMRPAEAIPSSSWSALARSGRNGLYFILLGLFWWRRAFEAMDGDVSKASARKEWDSVAIDLLWVMSTWTICSPSPTPSSSPSPTPSRSPSPPTHRVPQSQGPSPSKQAQKSSPRRKRKHAGPEESARARKRKR